MTPEQEKILLLGKARRRRAEAEGQADKLHSRFYSDMPRQEFNKRLGLEAHELPPGKSSIEKTADFLTGQAGEFANTLTFGLADKVAGGANVAEEYVRDLMGKGLYKDMSEAYYAPRKERENFRKEYPKTAMTATMAGAMTNPAAKAVGGWMGGATSLPGKMARGLLGGAGMAGTQTGVEVSDLPISPKAKALATGESMTLGGAIGGAAPAVVPWAIKYPVKWGQKGWDYVKNQLGGRWGTSNVQNSRAWREIAQAMEADGLTPQQAMKQLQKMGPKAAVMDLGENLQNTAYATKGRPGEGKAILTKFLRDRQEGTISPSTGKIKGAQSQRIEKGLEDMFPESNYYKASEMLKRDTRAKEFYDRAFRSNKTIENNEIDRLLKTSSGQKALNKARLAMSDERKLMSQVDPELTALGKEQGITTGKGIGRGLKLETLDKVKQELAVLEQQAMTTNKNNPLGPLEPTPESMRITKIRRRLTTLLDSEDISGSDYATARKLAGDKIAQKAALNEGMRFMQSNKVKPEALDIKLADMTPEEKHFFRIGVVQSMKDKTGDLVVRADTTKKLADIPNLEEKIESAFGDKKLFVKYKRLIGSEKKMFDTYSKVLQGSRTAENQQTLAESAIDRGRVAQGMADLAGGRYLRGAMNVGGGVKDYLYYPEAMTGPMAKALAGRDLSGLNQVYTSEIMRKQLPQGLADALMRGAVVSGGANVAGQVRRK